MFLGYKTFDFSWGLDFMGNGFVAVQCKKIHYFVKHLRGRKFVGTGYPRI